MMNSALNDNWRGSMWILVAIFLLALFLRLSLVYFSEYELMKDALGYHTLAVNILHGDGFSNIAGEPTTMRSPAYPVFLAIIYALFGADYNNALYAQAFLHALLVMPIFWLARRMTGSTRVALLAGLIFSLHTSFEIVGRLYSENLLIPLALLFVVSAAKLLEHEKMSFLHALYCGMLIGLMGLTKMEYGLFGLCFFILCLLLPSLRSQWKMLLVVVLLPLLMATGWQLRNSLIHDDGQNTLANYTLIFSYYPAISGSWWWSVTDMEALERERLESDLHIGRYSYDELRQQVKKALFENPSGLLSLISSRVLILWVSPPVGSSLVASYWSDGKWLMLILQYVFAGGAIILLLSRCRDEKLIAVLALFLYMTVVYGLIHSMRRYGYAFVPELSILASWAFFYVWEKFKLKLASR